jgi:hypothetical protein
MRWAAVGIACACLLGCPAPAQYKEVRPDLSCDRATRVAYRTLMTLGYTVTDVVVASPERTGAVTGTKTDPDGTVRTGRVKITCDAKGARLQPIEDALVPTYEFSRAFGYSFKVLVQRPDVEEPSAASGLQLLFRAISPQEATLDLGGVPTLGGAVPVRVTIRNDTDRAVAFDPARLELVPAAGAASAPLGGRVLEAAVAPGPAGDRVRAERLGAQRVAAHATVSGYLVFPPGVYREARVTIEDVETGEGEGFVAPVQ